MNINIEEMRMNTDMSRAYLKNQNEFDVFPMYIENHLAGDFACAVAVKLAKQQARIKELTENLDLALNYVKNLEIAIDDIGGYTQEQIYENVPECNFNFNTALSLLSLPKPPEGES